MRYSGSYNSVDVGITRDGYSLQHESFWEQIAESDAYGLSLIDGIYRGGNLSIEFEGLAYKSGTTSPFWPWALLGKMATTALPIARLASNVASTFVLTATANTPAATSPATVTANLAILAPNYPARWLYSSRLRTVPIRLALIPNTVATDTVWFA